MAGGEVERPGRLDAADGCFGIPPGRRPTFGRIDHHDTAQNHKHQEDDTIDEEHALHARQAEDVSRIQQASEPAPGQLDPDGRPEPEAGDGESGDHSLLVGEPFDPHGDGHDVGQPDPGSTDDADAHELWPEGSAQQAPQDVTHAQDDAAGHGDYPRAGLGLPAPGKEHDEGECRQSRREDPLCLACRETVTAVSITSLERGGEYAPGVDGAEAQLDQNSPDHHKPAVHDLCVIHGRVLRYQAGPRRRPSTRDDYTLTKE